MVNAATKNKLEPATSATADIVEKIPDPTVAPTPSPINENNEIFLLSLPSLLF